MVAAPPPVLLVPGWSDTARVLQPCREFLLAGGWPGQAVRCLSFRDRHGSNIDHALEISAAAQEMKELTGTPRIAVVAHSMGGLALRYYLMEGGDAAVHTAIFAATPHHGTWAAWLARGRGGAEMRPGSEFLERLNAKPLQPSVRAICLRTPVDTRVLPGHSACLDGATCHTVRLPTHPRMLRHSRTLQLIRELLLDERARAA
jgi:triacylglycerol lipase